jgi:hypothetical protein
MGCGFSPPTTKKWSAGGRVVAFSAEKLVGLRPSSEEVQQQAEELHADVILVDVSMWMHRWAGDDTPADAAAS